MMGLCSCLVIFIAFINCKVVVMIPRVSVSESFIEHEISPDILCEPPLGMMTVLFPSGAAALEGNILNKSQVTDPPAVEWESHPNSFYTLMMFDLDMPNRNEPEGRAFLHWLVGNIPNKLVAVGETITNFLRTNPDPDTGLHRIVFLVYEQPDELHFEEAPDDSFDARINFYPEEFAEKYKMGLPLAGNFYLIESKDYK